MNRARFVAALIAAVGVTITVTGAGSALWLYRHEPVPRHTHNTSLLPAASSAPFPQSAIGDPGPMHYVGVFEHDTASNYRSPTLFTSVAGRKPNLSVYYSGWGKPFPARVATAAAQGGAVMLVHMEPWHHSLAAIAAGGSDRYLRQFAGAVRHYGGHVIISFAPEADGRWYPWGWHHARAAQWVAAWRHVVTVFRQAGAINVTWLWVMSGDSRATGHLRNWWPGAGYVNWIGVDGYYYKRPTRSGPSSATPCGPSGGSLTSRSCSPRSASGRGPGRPRRSPACSLVSGTITCWAWSTST